MKLAPKPSAKSSGGGASAATGVEFLAAIGIGFRPTVAGTHRTIEAYLLDYSGEPLYGDAVLLRFSKRLRGEEKFDSLDALKAQMERDVAQVRNGG